LPAPAQQARKPRNFLDQASLVRPDSILGHYIRKPDGTGGYSPLRDEPSESKRVRGRDKQREFDRFFEPAGESGRGPNVAECPVDICEDDDNI